MKYYFAPMEGITGYIYRNAYHEFFYPMDKYFTPFLVPNQNKSLKSKELNDILPEHNQGLNVIPQILTNSSEDFIWIAGKLKQLGYNEINLNLGCPSRTVVSKDKGSGFLAKPFELNQFLDTIFSKLDMKISIKTRIGKDSADEFSDLIQIYNRYPLEELIIHPRIQQDYYKNSPNLEVFQDALIHCTHSICYNGDIFKVTDYDRFAVDFPATEKLMLGRGLIANPGLISDCKKLPGITKQQLYEFHNRIYVNYQEILSGDRNTLFKMKELWFYLSHLFSNSKKGIKRIKKAQKKEDYEVAVRMLFEEFELSSGDDRGFNLIP